MKVAINKCWGGFGLSNEATMMIVDAGFPLEGYDFDPKKELHYKTVRTAKELKNGWTIYGSEKPLHTTLVKNGKAYYAGSIEDKLRSHPILIKVIEKLGKSANGQFANIEIINIPDDVDFEIDDYDGQESIHEKHRSW